MKNSEEIRKQIPLIFWECFPEAEIALDLEGQVVIYTGHYEPEDCNQIKFTDEDNEFSGSHYKGQF